MSKTKPSGASHYEILFIIPNRFTEEEAKANIERVEKMIIEEGGVITLNEYWGKKHLAYQIKGEFYGYYNLMEFDIEGKSLKRLDEKLRMSHEVLRFMIVSKKLKSEDELKREKAIKEKIASKKASQQAKEQADEKTVEPIVEAADELITPKKATRAKTAKAKDEDKADLKNLDEKLEGILNAKDLL